VTDLKISVGGLAALSRGLKKIDADAPRQMRLCFNAAADLLVDRTKPTVPEKSGAARRSIKARSTRTSARVGVGGRKAPYFPWLDFGGQGRIAGRPAARDFLKEGRYIYPTLRKIRPQIEQSLHDGISAVIAGAGMVED
jgi:hypothetical protein